MRPLTIALIGGGLGVAVIAGLVGCGGGTTTIVEKTVIERAHQSEAPARPALLKLPTYENWMIEPVIYSFGVSGAMAGHDLAWSGWGSNTAEGRGRFWERQYEGANNFNDYRKYPATVIASSLETCEGRQFYTRVEAVAAWGVVDGPIQLPTPCTGSAPFSPDAVTPRSETGD